MGGHNNITDLDSYDNNNFEFSVIHLVINAIFKFFFAVCKHYITHGCKLGNSCKFLHCTPEELANKMATNDPPARNGPKPSFNSHDSPRLKQEFNYPSPSRHRQDSTENKMDISENSSSRKSD